MITAETYVLAVILGILLLSDIIAHVNASNWYRKGFTAATELYSELIISVTKSALNVYKKLQRLIRLLL